MSGEVMKQERMEELAAKFLRKNYNYIWLKTMLEKGMGMFERRKGTLITGSSHALNGIVEAAWENAVNCSMHSQDLYYDFACARKVMQDKEGFRRCFIVFGYYIAFQDLSLSKGMRDYIVSPVFYPVLGDAHNWEEPVGRNLWADFEMISEEDKRECIRLAQQMVYRESTYYSKLKRRKPFFDFQGRPWTDLTEEEQDDYGRQRAEGHNSVLKYTGSYEENCGILKDYIHFLHLHDTEPIVIIPPFTEAYNRYVDDRLRDAVKGLVQGVEEKVSFLDFNGLGLFIAEDFMDTDHLNENGALKMSRILAERFGR